MTLAVLSIGSNVGDRLARLRGVIAAAGERLVLASSAYETAPWGGVEQEPFLNAVVVVRDEDAAAEDWLEFAQQCERAAGRERDVRWGPRTLDVDVIAVYDDAGQPVTIDAAELSVPHPRAHERAFVLAPWAEIQPDAELPQGPVETLLRELVASGDPEQRVVRLDEVVLEVTR